MTPHRTATARPAKRPWTNLWGQRKRLREKSKGDMKHLLKMDHVLASGTARTGRPRDARGSSRAAIVDDAGARVRRCRNCSINGRFVRKPSLEAALELRRPPVRHRLSFASVIRCNMFGFLTQQSRDKPDALPA